VLVNACRMQGFEGGFDPQIKRVVRDETAPL
jgi:hypothetical protein